MDSSKQKYRGVPFSSKNGCMHMCIHSKLENHPYFMYDKDFSIEKNPYLFYIYNFCFRIYSFSAKENVITGLGV